MTQRSRRPAKGGEGGSGLATTHTGGPCTPDGESIVEHIASIEGYQVVLATYHAACERWPGTPITLRQGARVRRLRVV